jgi:hypothetical protein
LQSADGIDFTLLYQRQIPWGTLTWLTEVTCIYDFRFPEGETAFGLGLGSGNLVGFTTNPGASNEGFYQWKGNTRIDWAWQGFDLAATVRYNDGFDELDPDLLPRSVDSTVRLDLQASYDFTALLPVEEQPVPGYSKGSKEVVRGKDGAPLETASAQTSNYGRSILDHVLRGTVLTVGCTNVFDDDPPFASGEGGNAVGYPGFTYDATGRFVYVRLTKKF